MNRKFHESTKKVQDHFQCSDGKYWQTFVKQTKEFKVQVSNNNLLAGRVEVAKLLKTGIHILANLFGICNLLVYLVTWGYRILELMNINS